MVFPEGKETTKVATVQSFGPRVSGLGFKVKGDLEKLSV